MKQEAQREIKREVEKFVEDLECWWADLNNGDGVCDKRTREKAMEECWKKEGMTWDWDSQECMTWEQ